WDSQTDLHLATTPPQMLPGIVDANSPPITTDVDNDPRSADAPFRGADELPAPGEERADLAVGTSAAPTNFLGSPTTITLTIVNGGQSVAADVVLTQTLTNFIPSAN